MPGMAALRADAGVDEPGHLVDHYECRRGGPRVAGLAEGFAEDGLNLERPACPAVDLHARLVRAHRSRAGEVQLDDIIPQLVPERAGTGYDLVHQSAH